MNKYVVKVVHVFSNLVHVEASSEEDARQKAMEYISNDKTNLKNYYEATIPPENWHVIEEEEFNKIKAEAEEKLKVKSASEEKSNIIVP